MTIHTINTSIIQKTQHLELKLSAPSSTELVNVYNILAQVLIKNVSFLRASGKFQLELSVKITFILLFIVIIIIIIIDVAMRVYL